ncbi:MAG TPA: FMN-binding negative transcriptional regulator [Gammaproteobacteria bacterium]|nr:FMN-binding negative transcriptional regulator [Gammaproteobacteria bacterium]
MYTPRAFSVTDAAKLAAFIRDNAFGTLVTVTAGRPEASHIPFLFDSESGVLSAHLAAANPQVRRLADVDEALVMFQGPHGYISPSWYESSDVPTWNYTTVHVYGRPEILDDDAEVRAIVDSLTRKYEAQFDKPWQPAYDARLLKAIVGFRIHVAEIQGKFKLSQNRSMQDRANVIRELQKTGRESDVALAEFMANFGAGDG